jgi:hypothetical protein
VVEPLWAAPTGDPSTHQGLDRKIAWRHFTNAPSAMDFDDAHAEKFSDGLAADLREALGRYPADTTLKNLVTRLQAGSPDFANRGRQAQVARHRSSTKTVTATPVGAITIDCDVLTPPGTDLRIVMYTVTPNSEDASKLDLLRVCGTHALISP